MLLCFMWKTIKLGYQWYFGLSFRHAYTITYRSIGIFYCAILHEQNKEWHIDNAHNRFLIANFLTLWYPHVTIILCSNLNEIVLAYLDANGFCWICTHGSLLVIFLASSLSQSVSSILVENFLCLNTKVWHFY